MNIPPKWKRFEHVVKSIQEQLTPNSKIVYDYRVIGKTTGVDRQVDIALFSQIGQFDIFIAMDCKDYKKPVDVKEVESFATMLEDINADKGVMVTYKGFSSAARKVAEKKRIDLLKMIDVESEEWPVQVSIPAIIDDRGIKQMQITISSSYSSPLVIPPVDPRYLLLFNEDGSLIGSITNILVDKWNKGKIEDRPGVNSFDLIKVFVRDGKDSYPCDIRVNYTVSQKLYFGQIGISELKGFYKCSDNSVVTKKLVTELIDFDTIENNWVQLKSLSDVENPPTVYMVIHDGYNCEY